MLIPEPSTAESVAVAAAAATFATDMEANAQYELATTTNCWVARARALTFADAEFVADDTTTSSSSAPPTASPPVTAPSRSRKAAARCPPA
jgi:hypothetical protein